MVLTWPASAIFTMSVISVAFLQLVKRSWESLKQVMAPGGALEPLVKEMLYLAVSTTNGCEYCIRSHTAAARKAGMSEAMLGELMAVVGMANETNRLANGYQVEVDAQFMTR